MFRISCLLLRNSFINSIFQIGLSFAFFLFPALFLLIVIPLDQWDSDYKMLAPVYFLLYPNLYKASFLLLSISEVNTY
jgi:hypothetical protein